MSVFLDHSLRLSRQVPYLNDEGLVERAAGGSAAPSRGLPRRARLLARPSEVRALLLLQGASGSTTAKKYPDSI